jgi:hypothetical protein
MKTKSILVVPDAHAKPGVSNERFEWLGNYIAEKKPGVVISIGDFADMQSLSSYDLGKASAENQRYEKDVKATRDALRKMMLPVVAEMQRVNKKGLVWNPEFHITLGNHEQRIDRYMDDNPQLMGALSVDDLGFKECGWNVVPFLQPLEVEGIVFQHYFTSGVMGRPIAGDHAAANAVKKNLASCVFGHSHLRSLWETVDCLGRKRIGVNVGCFFEHDEHYTKENHRFWRGLVRLHDCHDGQFNPEFVSMNYLKKHYG